MGFFCHEVSGFLEPLPAFCHCQRSQLFPHIDLLEAFKSGFSQEERSIHPNHCWPSSSKQMGSTQIKVDKSQKQWYHICAIFLSKWCFDPNNHYQSREQSRPVWRLNTLPMQHAQTRPAAALLWHKDADSVVSVMALCIAGVGACLRCSIMSLVPQE